MTTEIEQPRKTKTVVVVKRPGGPKRSLLLTRRLRSNDDLDALQPSALHRTAPMGVGYDQDGNLISRTVLGAVDFEEVERLEAPLEQSVVEDNRTMTTRSRRSSKPPSAAETAAELAVMDPVGHQDTYLNTLRTAHERATRKGSWLAETTQSVVVGERLKQAQPSKVLTLWQQRQREWEQIQAQIAKATNKQREQLLTTIADQHRLKLEEYDTLQAAMANSEEFNQGATWEMQLRGGGERFIRIGNVFSGLYRPIHNKVQPPPQVRRPGKLPAMNVTQKLQSNKFLAGRKERLSSKYEQIRPHQVVDSEMDALLVVAIPLFLWAQESSAQYFEHIASSTSTSKVSHSGHLVTAPVSRDGSGQLSARGSSSTRAAATADPAPSTLQLWGSPLLDFVFDGRGATTQIFSFQNTSSSVVSFSISSKKRAKLDWELLRPQGDGHALPPTLQRAVRDQPFACLRHEGCARPGETVHIPFVCTVSLLDLGVYEQEWTFTTEPSGAIAAFLTSDGRGFELVTPFTITTRAIRVEHQNNEHRRLQLQRSLDRTTVANWMNEFVLSCLRRVRTPITDESVRCLQLAAFRQRNAEFYTRLATEHDLHALRCRSNIFVTIEHFDTFNCFTLKLKQLRAAVMARERWHEQARATARNGEILEDYSVDTVRVMAPYLKDRDDSGQTASGSSRSRYIDRELEIFDSVSPQVAQNNWDGDLDNLVREVSVVRGILETLTRAEIELAAQFVKLAKDIAGRRRKEAKERRKQRRRDRRRVRKLRKQHKKLLKAGKLHEAEELLAQIPGGQPEEEGETQEEDDKEHDTDSNDEEEEQEHGDEASDAGDDEDNAPTCKASLDILATLPHPDRMVHEFLKMEAELLSACAMPLLPRLSSTQDLAREVALEIVEAVMHTQHEAASLANLKEMPPVMPNPFDPAQQETFQLMLQNGRNPPKKIIPADVFHASWHDSALKVVTDTVVRGWGKQHKQLHENYRHAMSERETQLALQPTCGIVRRSDLAAKNVILHVDLTAFLPVNGEEPAAATTAMDVAATRKRVQRAAVLRSIRDAVDAAASKVVCVCESWRWSEETQSFQEAGSALAKYFSNLSVHFSSTLADAADAVRNPEIQIIILDNVGAPSIHAPIPAMTVEESDDEDEAWPSVLKLQQQAVSTAAISPGANEAASWHSFFQECAPCVIVENNTQGFCTKWGMMPDPASCVDAPRLLGQTVAEHVKLASLIMCSSNVNSEPPTNVVVVIGGLASVRRFQSIAALIREVDDIFVGGELCVPFLMAQDALPVAVQACHGHLRIWKGLAAQLLSEAHRFGTRLHLPTEFMLCHDDRSLDELRQLSAQMTVFDELDIETTVLDIENPVEKQLPGRICDVTDRFTDRVKDAIQQHNKLLWLGPLGVMEVANFHRGTESLFSTVMSLHETHCKAFDETPDLKIVEFEHFTAVVGEQLYHWCNQFAELDDGLLLGSGEGVTFAAADSSLICSILCGNLTNSSPAFTKRPPEASERLWAFHQQLIAERHEDDDVEADEEDEDDDDDDDDNDNDSSSDEEAASDNH